ncbi:MAG TPA: GNAT family N-acetyltransferase [Candidatus Acidoferrales bacterium]|nr:GNAT family N-acetyltransferase [Candidatus Acidoferrales bacterium]
MAEVRIESLWPRDLDSTSYRELVTSQFGASAWPAHRDYYRWLFEQAPTAKTGQPLTVLVAREGERLVGHRAMIVVEVAVDGRRLRGAWGVDHFVKASHRGKEVGARLLNTDLDTCDIGMSIGQTEAGYRIASKHGYRDTGAMLRFTRVLRPLRSAAQRILAKAGLNRFAPSLLGFPAPRQQHVSNDIAVETVRSFADRLDDRSDLRGLPR